MYVCECVGVRVCGVVCVRSCACVCMDVIHIMDVIHACIV